MIDDDNIDNVVYLYSPKKETEFPLSDDALPSTEDHKEVLDALLEISQKKEEGYNSLSDSTVSIFLHVSMNLLDLGVLFGLLHVRDGKDQITDHGPLLNKEIYFEHADRRKTLESIVKHRKIMGFQFKCFVNHEGIPFKTVKKMLKKNGFKNISRGGGKSYRTWFILPEYPTCHTVDGILNNFFYPA